jgi:anionic cell wall polymer biosynthesis LytR-Cps2A-Psr (LCP) family protein
MILMAVNPLQPRVTMLSIPRDLWVSIPNVGENRINTAHFFAEAADPGSGPRAALETVRQNFRRAHRYYVRVRFDGFVEIINAMDGVTITWSSPPFVGGGNPPPGRHPGPGLRARPQRRR